MTHDLHPLCTLVRDALDYNATTGELVWRRATGTRAEVGRAAGSIDRHGHIRISLNGREYAAHRLVWLHVVGQMPSGDIDHINGDRSDNRISNLRDVPHRVNLENRRRAAAHNISGFLGVSKRGGSYLARIKVDGKQVCLGSFSSAEMAHVAYLTAKRELHAGCTL